MRYAPSLQHRRLGRADVHAPIHLHRVDRHDLGAEVLGETHSNFGLARGGGPEQCQDPGQTVLPTR
jgi:hypothetical protein